jgi:putative FmdB family regulatory protein
MRYTYKCPQCGATVERDFSLAKNPPTVQCECGGQAERHFSSTPPVQFKGRGWTVTGHGIGEHTPKNQDAADLPGGAADSFTGQVI